MGNIDEKFQKYVSENLRFDWHLHFRNLLSEGYPEFKINCFIALIVNEHPELQKLLEYQFKKALADHEYLGSTSFPKRADGLEGLKAISLGR